MNAILSTDADILGLLRSVRSIAVVGISVSSHRPSFGVARYLMDAGYEIIPVNPHIAIWQGIPAYPSLTEIGRAVDLVDVFRKPEYVLGAVEDAIAAKTGAVWTQLGVVSDEATNRAVEAGLPIVVDRCTAIEHRRLIADPEMR